MNIEERLVADYAGTGLTVGKHPMHYRRAELRRSNMLSAQELRLCRDGEYGGISTYRPGVEGRSLDRDNFCSISILGSPY
jgi:hypothetical protein